ncbi:MAG: hypothetical protein ACYC27_21890 [Armatimonadota bacterium]
MAVYRLRCDIEYPDTPEGLAAGNAVIDVAASSSGSSVSGSADLHLCRHDEDPPAPCDPAVRSESWGGGGYA